MAFRLPLHPELLPQRRLASWRKTLAAADPDHGLFNGGPPTGLQILLGLMEVGKFNIRFRILVAVAIGWVPLLLLTALQEMMLRDGSLRGFLGDYALHARNLIAVPLLILAEKQCLPRLSGIARAIRDGDLVPPQEMPRLQAAMGSTARLRDSLHLEIAVAGLAAVLIATLFFTLPPNFFPAWHRLGNSGRISPAGWWHALVSVPILVILLLGWFWRLAVWTRFLWLVSRLKLCLIPSHPDGTAGLKFIGLSVQSFSVLAFALGMIVAGSVANRVVHDHASVMSFKTVFLWFDALCLAMFVGPLLVFSSPLVEVWRRGAQEYGALARRLGQQLERKWLNQELGADALSAPDFSATTDLYSIAANVYTLNPVPVTLRQLIVLAVAGLLPFLPVIMLAVPPQELVMKLVGLLI